MAWYKVGTINVTNNSATVTGVGTAWVGAVLRGEGVVMPNGVLYEIDLVNSGTSITLARPYTGPTASGQSYSICPIQDYLKVLASQAAELLNVVNDTVAGVFGVGSVTLPSIRTTADPDTGLNLLGNNELSLVTAGVDRFKIGATGTPSGTAADYLRDRTNHTGSQAISTITDLQTTLDAKVAQTDVGSEPNQVPSNQHLGALAFMDAIGVVQATQHTPDAKPGESWKQISGNGFTEKFVDPSGNILDVTPQTVPGALAQMQGFGLGNTAGVNIANLETHRTSGAFLADATVSTAGGLPLTLQHIITYRPGTSTANGEMWATPLTTSTANGGRVWFRKLNSNVWQPWKEVAFLDSPAFTGTPSSPSLKLGNVASADVSTLDHYEEGSFTPTLYGKTAAGTNTYAVNVGRYTRIGNRVFWEARFQLSTSSGMTGQLAMAGLPFNVVNNSSARGAVTIGYYAGLSDTAAYDFRAFHNHGAATVDILKRSVGMSVSGAFPAEEVVGTAQLYMSGHYSVS